MTKYYVPEKGQWMTYLKSGRTVDSMNVVLASNALPLLLG